MKKINKKNILFILVFIIGFLLTVYPLISQWYYRIEAKDEVDKFNAGTEELDSSEIQRRIELARAYNSSLDPSKLSDPYTEKEKEGRAEYARMLEVEEMIGHVEVPKIGEDLPIYAGTSDDILARGAGHLEGTSLPVGGASTHAVITAHRGLPSATLFRHLDDLNKGDVFFIHNIETTLAYKVDQITTVEPWDFEKVLVISGKDYVTLLTCTPYMINSHRLLVRGHRIEYTPAVQEEALKQNKRKINYLKLLIISLIILIVLIIIWFRERKKFRSLRKR
ncbi:class C sortase [uncultured Peptoniphilus sp.]|uniref:class C sortase n=1 Tax=uncultured Peptoniphilus sp. TaxID=254354 RepID=UPI00280396B9|nr:class C sortase [uncultured Peptoniphilus sp.]